MAGTDWAMGAGMEEEDSAATVVVVRAAKVALMVAQTAAVGAVHRVMSLPRKVSHVQYQCSPNLLKERL